MALPINALFSGCGSQSSDIVSVDAVQNPLPPCPETLNCIRITKHFDRPADTIFDASIKTIQAMSPEELNVENDKQKIESVFKVFFFRDDMSLQCTKADVYSTYLHMRSASRVGFTDLRVNTRRIKRFLSTLPSHL